MAITPYNFNFETLGSELDVFFAEMEAKAANLLSETSGSALTKKMKTTGATMFGNGFQVDVCENENEIIVTTDLPGIEKKDITVRLLNPQTLLIRTEVTEETDEVNEAGTYHIRERRTGNVQRSIHLPVPVTGEGAKASFKNGVMEITLSKDVTEKGIPIKVQ